MYIKHVKIIPCDWFEICRGYAHWRTSLHMSNPRITNFSIKSIGCKVEKNILRHVMKYFLHEIKYQHDYYVIYSITELNVKNIWYHSRYHKPYITLSSHSTGYIISPKPYYVISYAISYDIIYHISIICNDRQNPTRLPFYISGPTWEIFHLCRSLFS